MVTIPPVRPFKSFPAGAFITHLHLVHHTAAPNCRGQAEEWLLSDPDDRQDTNLLNAKQLVTVPQRLIPTARIRPEYSQRAPAPAFRPTLTVSYKTQNCGETIPFRSRLRYDHVLCSRRFGRVRLKSFVFHITSIQTSGSRLPVPAPDGS